MGFNYSKEKRIFDKEWERLSEQYKKAGMNEEAIQELYDFDFRSFFSCETSSNQSHIAPVLLHHSFLPFCIAHVISPIPYQR